MMDVKSDAFSDKKAVPVYDQTDPAHLHTARRLPRREQLVRRTLPAILLLSVLWFLFRAAFVHDHHYCPHKDLLEPAEGVPPSFSPAHDADLVPLEAHIMSKCPDAKACLQKLVLPSMVEISDMVNFTLSYIGEVDSDSDEVSCKHGPGECLGNIIQLCAAKEYPNPRIYLGFANCMISSYQHIPERDLVEGCALEHGVDFQKLNKCISDEGEGIDLLRASVERSRDANVTKSCTVRLAGEVRCIRDGGEWYDCPGGSNVSDLVDEIKALYKE